jgi:hypothetical protein
LNTFTKVCWSVAAPASGGVAAVDAVVAVADVKVEAEVEPTLEP